MPGDAAVVEQGLFHGESLCVRFAFTHADFVSAVKRYSDAGGNGPMPEDLRTYVHELTHSVQHATTPYGMFLHYCRMVQTEAAIALVKGLWRQGLEPSPMLLTSLPALGGEAGLELRRWLSIWFNVEFLTGHISQDPDKQVNLFQWIEGADASVLPPLLPVQETLWGVQEMIAKLINTQNSQRDAMGLPVWDQAGFDQGAIEAAISATPTKRDMGLERTEAVLNLTGNPWGVSAIIESAATASEFARSGRDLAGLRAWLEKPHNPSLEVYRSCLQRGLEAIPADDLPQFLFSYVALCELALFAPLLPQHAGLRGPRFPMEQIFPVTRFNLLLGAATKVAPMRGLRDHARYVTDLCQHLQWVHPIQIVAAAVERPHSVADPRAQVYVNAQLARAQELWSFLDVTGIVMDNSQWGCALRDNCTFVVVEYSDKTLCHRNKEYLAAMTNQHLMMLAMRHVMLGEGLLIPSPYRCDERERQALTEMLRMNLQACFGRQFPMAEVV